MPSEDVEPGREIGPGVFYARIYDSRTVKIDRFVVKPGVTVAYHGNADGQGYKLVACSDLKFLSLTEDGRVLEYRQMSSGETLIRAPGFKHTLVNTNDRDFVALKAWPWPPPKD
jgi:hypothetical protein